jgi:L-ribulose-5-phosphate 3-epimerase UlaE
MCKTPEQKIVKQAIEAANLIGLRAVRIAPRIVRTYYNSNEEEQLLKIATKSLKHASIRRKYHP